MLSLVYCDESMTEALVNADRGARCLAIGSVWLSQDRLEEARLRIQAIRDSHGIYGEMKWGKISPSAAGFYRDIVDLFFESNDSPNFRCIIVDNTKVDLSFHNDNPELGFYKFYYQMLIHRFQPGEEYRIFCDQKTNADSKRIGVLERCLRNGAKASDIVSVQALPSADLVMMQVCDVLLGAVSATYNPRNAPMSEAKRSVIARIEQHLGHRIRASLPSERKFNVFQIRLTR